MRVATALAVALAACAATANAAAPPLREHCVRTADHARVVTFRTSDHVKIVGVVLGDGRVGVVLGHELHTDLCNWLPFARVLAANGFRVLDIDFRGGGSSASAAGAGCWRIDRDMLGAAKYLRSTGSPTIFLAGASMGGTAAVVAGAALRPAPAGVISVSGASEFSSLDAVSAARKLRAPALFVAGKDDIGFADDATAMYGASASAAKRLLLADSGLHGTGLLQGAGSDGVRAALLEFVKNPSAPPGP